MSELDPILRAHCDTEPPLATFRAVDAALAQSPGHILFTILIHRPALHESGALLLQQARRLPGRRVGPP